jgi:hypothetical protein
MKFDDLQAILAKSRRWHAREQQQAKLHPAAPKKLAPFDP